MARSQGLTLADGRHKKNLTKPVSYDIIKKKEVTAMYEFGVHHRYCGMTTIIFGYDFYDAGRRAKLEVNLWEIDYQEYVD